MCVQQYSSTAQLWYSSKTHPQRPANPPCVYNISTAVHQKKIYLVDVTEGSNTPLDRISELTCSAKMRVQNTERCVYGTVSITFFQYRRSGCVRPPSFVEDLPQNHPRGCVVLRVQRYTTMDANVRLGCSCE